jgi:AbrB family looped-hinge helix DNA binding protein
MAAAIPAEIRDELGLHEGDYVDVKREGSRIVLTPKTVVDRHPEIDAALAEGLADVRAGRLSPSFKNMRQFGTDASVAIAEAAGLLVVRHETRGRAAAINRGVQEATAPIICVLRASMIALTQPSCHNRLKSINSFSVSL